MGVSILWGALPVNAVSNKIRGHTYRVAPSDLHGWVTHLGDRFFVSFISSLLF